MPRGGACYTTKPSSTLSSVFVPREHTALTFHIFCSRPSPILPLLPLSTQTLTPRSLSNRNHPTTKMKPQNTMHSPSTILLLSAFLAGQVATAAYIPHHARTADILTRTQIRTVYSTRVVVVAPESAIPAAEGLPTIAPAITDLSMPLSSILALISGSKPVSTARPVGRQHPGVNPINNLPLPSVQKPKPVSTENPHLGVNPINHLPAPTVQKTSPGPAANTAAAAGIASILGHVPKHTTPKAPTPTPTQNSALASQAASRKAAAAAAAAIASIVAHQTPRPIPFPKPSSTQNVASAVSSLFAALPHPLDQISKGAAAKPKSSTKPSGIVIVPVTAEATPLKDTSAPLLVAAGPTPAPNVPTPKKGKESARILLAMISAAQEGSH